MAKSYVKFSTPGDLQKKAQEAVSAAVVANGLRKGTNETTKAVERGEAKLVVIAEDVDPEEIVMHLPGLCAEKRVPYLYFSDKLSVGKAAGLSVGCATVAITNAGSAESSLKEIVQKLVEIAPNAVSASSAPKAEEKKEAKAPAAKKK